MPGKLSAQNLAEGNCSLNIGTLLPPHQLGLLSRNAGSFCFGEPASPPGKPVRADSVTPIQLGWSPATASYQAALSSALAPSLYLTPKGIDFPELFP